MPAVSKKQQRFFGIVRAIQKGEMAATTPETAKAAYNEEEDVKILHLPSIKNFLKRKLPKRKKLFLRKTNYEEGKTSS